MYSRCYTRHRHRRRRLVFRTSSSSSRFRKLEPRGDTRRRPTDRRGGKKGSDVLPIILCTPRLAVVVACIIILVILVLLLLYTPRLDFSVIPCGGGGGANNIQFSTFSGPSRNRRLSVHPFFRYDNVYLFFFITLHNTDNVIVIYGNQPS